MSWLRSREANVDIDRPSADFVDQVPADTVLTRAARHVLDEMAAEIENEPVALILTDANGTVLHRYAGDRSLVSALDRVDLAPGFRYAESQVGTNGIGTALEVGAPLLIRGEEHYNGPLKKFSCAGALVTHPVTGAVLGVVDLTTLADNTNALLLSFAKLAATRIRERILDETNELDRALLHDYHIACRHSGRPVIAIGDEVLMMNTSTQQKFDSRDQAAIIDRTRDARGRTEAFTTLADLPSGITARLSYQPIFVADTLAGGIVRIKEQVERARALGRDRLPALQSVAGSSAQWKHTVRSIVDVCTRREWLVLDGEPGVGKTTLLRAAHVSVRGGHDVSVLDAAVLTGTELLDQVSNTLDAGSDLVVLHAHVLSDGDLTVLSELLHTVRLDSPSDEPWVALTTHVSQGVPDTHPLLRLFPKTISVPPLRHHLEDIPELVRHLLDRAGAADLTMSTAACNQLMRLSWRGNVAHLRSVLDEVGRHRRSGVIEPQDLPAECRATTRRTLTQLEALERDAVVDALALHDGDKAAAAKALGMSRATIYRKIREFGIVF
ncbi:helix-turn-helix domain-containing protein [Rhodococcus sp. CC-R104]|uniref:Helix-turn-helix domain-containing protein n=1 Tax=Rhodococcus chondri TaxID=3065941 RepID=A0ABU7JKJ2_9NOCA|nr:helix-turn-helix domain-containing protein [Rhodococcus sp. CC-R104]MEE2030557.1 helix-turn-helix domain-containing protein [Rhodococcus sp. CC-R104]